MNGSRPACSHDGLTGPMRHVVRVLIVGPLLAVASGAAGMSATPQPPVDFDRQVRPILAENCYTCHGPDSGRRKAELRLDQDGDDLVERAIITPGNAAESELIARVVSDDRATRMPPP